MPPPCRHVHVVSGKGTAEQAAGGASWASPLARNRAARSLLVLAALSCGPSRERVAASGCAAGTLLTQPRLHSSIAQIGSANGLGKTCYYWSMVTNATDLLYG